jgi:hypothetical protein
MRGNAFRVFLSGFRRAGLMPCLPDSVRDEVLNKYRENCDQLAKQAAKLAHDASRLVGRDVIQAFPDKKYTDLLYSGYSSHFFKTVTMEEEFEHLPYPSISHKDLAKRASEKRRPFREHDGGYRDSLLWSAILERLTKDKQPIAFVTNNTRDFGKGKLHEHLAEDLHQAGLAQDVITVFQTLSELNEALILPTLKRLDAVRDNLSDEVHPTSVRKWIDDSLLDLLSYEEGIGPLEPGHGRSWPSKIVDVQSITIDATRQLSPSQILVTATAELNLSLSISADWDDYQTYEDVRELFRSEDEEPFSFADADFPLELKVAFTLILDEDILAPISSEIDWFEDDYSGKVEINPHVTDSRTRDNDEVLEQAAPASE